MGADWQIITTGDFNGDRRADILWRHDSGIVHIWFMDGATVIATATPGAVGGDWQIAQVTDLDNGGRADILWRHANGSVATWLMDIVLE